MRREKETSDQLLQSFYVFIQGKKEKVEMSAAYRGKEKNEGYSVHRRYAPCYVGLVPMLYRAPWTVNRHCVGDVLGGGN
jgi:hypothetical protein